MSLFHSLLSPGKQYIMFHFYPSYEIISLLWGEGGILQCCQCLDRVTSNGSMTDEGVMGKASEGSGHGLINILYSHNL
jgi:hypothetical protein